MQADDQRVEKTGGDYSALPPTVRLDETITSVDAAPLPDPHAGRNMDQHRALCDD
jgi:hypothetical protein